MTGPESMEQAPAMTRDEYVPGATEPPVHVDPPPAAIAAGAPVPTMNAANPVPTNRLSSLRAGVLMTYLRGDAGP